MTNDHVSLLYSKNSKEKIPLLINLLKEYGIHQKKKIYIQSFDMKASYYVHHLISLISKIDFKIIDSYMFPVGAKNNEMKNCKIDAEQFVMAIEAIRESDIVISSSKAFPDEDWLDYVFDLSSIQPYQVIIIDNFDKFIEESNKNLRTIQKIINCYVKKYKAEVILFMSHLEKYDQSFQNWKVTHINDSFIFEYDKNNHQILRILEKENMDGKNRI